MLRAIEFQSLIGDQVALGGRYRIERLLGEGGMGVVVAARHIDLDEAVAIKLLARDVAAMPGMRDRFLQEARSSARLRGPHVAHVRDVGTHEDTPYLVMELLSGSDLAGVIEPRPLAIDLAVDYVVQTCEAIAEAHAAGIIHRDLKPANLFLAEEPDGTSIIKVVDFGISTGPAQVSRLTTESSVFGTPSYMSPEQLRSARLADARSDIWSLGAVLYELIEGRCPFTSESFAALCVQITIQDPAPMTQPVPPGLQRAIMKCLEKDREARFQSVGEFARAIVPYMRELALAARRLARIQRLLRVSA